MTSKHQINAEWRAIREHFDATDDRELGEQFKRYLHENMHSNWDLFKSVDVICIRHMLTDFLRYVKN